VLFSCGEDWSKLPQLGEYRNFERLHSRGTKRSRGVRRQPRCFTIPAPGLPEDAMAVLIQNGLFQGLLSAAIQLTSMTMRL